MLIPATDWRWLPSAPNVVARSVSREYGFVNPIFSLMIFYDTIILSQKNAIFCHGHRFVMGTDILSEAEKKQLLDLARQSIDLAVNGRPPLQLLLSEFSTALQENGATFVTLTKGGALRGCIGILEACQPLVQDVCEHAMAAAMSDFRFPTVNPDEVPELTIEISRLTTLQPLGYETPLDILDLLRPHIDGVVLQDGPRRATFLPQVWKKIPDPEDFLSHLCQKMGASGSLWREKVLDVSVYQVEEFSEDEV